MVKLFLYNYFLYEFILLLSLHIYNYSIGLIQNALCFSPSSVAMLEICSRGLSDRRVTRPRTVSEVVLEIDKIL